MEYYSNLRVVEHEPIRTIRELSWGDTFTLTKAEPSPENPIYMLLADRRIVVLGGNDASAGRYANISDDKIAHNINKFGIFKVK